MSKTLPFIIIFVPTLFILSGVALGTIGLKALWDSGESLECFCPSCPGTDFSNKGASSLGFIRVDIQGAVKSPGIYQLQIGQRVADLLNLAGGFSKDADQSYVAKTLNLALELKNEDKIYLPFLGENQDNSANSSSNSASLSSNLVSINNASSEQLQKLNGIGEVKAKAIIDNRPYSSLEELVTKGVVSATLLADLKNQLSL